MSRKGFYFTNSRFQQYFPNKECEQFCCEEPELNHVGKRILSGWGETFDNNKDIIQQNLPLTRTESKSELTWPLTKDWILQTILVYLEKLEQNLPRGRRFGTRLWGADMPSPQTAEPGLRLPGTEEGWPRKASGTETFSTSPVPSLAFKTQNFWQNFRQHQLTKHQVASTVWNNGKSGNVKWRWRKVWKASSSLPWCKFNRKIQTVTTV